GHFIRYAGEAFFKVHVDKRLFFDNFSDRNSFQEGMVTDNDSRDFILAAVAFQFRNNKVKEGFIVFEIDYSSVPEAE
ncbi:MAG: hypothetical protein PHN59_02490, partial [Candidatus Omnitrophica bacterium]|nr:hypothetical protein [Candidatus Omnitrophota bacterium]